VQAASSEIAACDWRPAYVASSEQEGLVLYQ